MNITVYLGSAFGNDPVYLEEAKKLGTWIGSHHHTLVYGGGSVGLMGVLADSVLAAGGEVIGVIPSFMVEKGWHSERLTELIIVESMPERKMKMLDLADCCIAFPGGIGTLEEISEALAREKLGLNSAPAIFYNFNGFYDDQIHMLEYMQKEGFLNAGNLIRSAENLTELETFLKQTEDRHDH